MQTYSELFPISGRETAIIILFELPQVRDPVIKDRKRLQNARNRILRLYLRLEWTQVSNKVVRHVPYLISRSVRAATASQNNMI